jgi:hypothetical protein
MATRGVGLSIGFPFKNTCPASGSTKPPSNLRSVDFPTPDGPTIEVNLSVSIEKLIS